MGCIGALTWAALAGCGSGSSPAADEPSPRYEIDTVVLDSGTGPELCAGGVATSMPPQCHGPAVHGFDWASVDHDAAGDVRWGTYHLLGTWDGTSFSLTGQPGAPRPAEDHSPVDFSPPCPEPEGGWPTATVTFEQWQAFRTALQEPADFASTWVDQRTNVADPGRDVVTVAYTGDPEAHRAALEAIWPGPLCVVQVPHTLRELQVIGEEMSNQATADELGVSLVSSSIDEVHGVVELRVMVAEPEVQSLLDERYGTGVVRLEGAMRPVE